eukprot:scaffold3068_cov401-Prasinococcus_capsulatus_cf.AAC.9
MEASIGPAGAGCSGKRGRNYASAVLSDALARRACVGRGRREGLTEGREGMPPRPTRGLWVVQSSLLLYIT